MRLSRGDLQRTVRRDRASMEDILSRIERLQKWSSIPLGGGVRHARVGVTSTSPHRRTA
jgi:hypothetical protein